MPHRKVRQTAEKLIGPANVPAAVREDLLTDRDNQLVQFKNGGQIESQWGRAWLGICRRLLEQEPRHFAALLALAQGRSGDVPPESMAFFKQVGGFLQGDDINPKVRGVLLSAYQETAEGPVLVNPFRFESEEQAREFEQEWERIENRNLDRLIRHLRKDEDDKDTQRGR